ncbi:hypothetical protein LTR37_013136 [Vermiconidia calcicola]|uniref:Uncharacterized protein n=1 Tax=Vermiconidia calcicola TaxID=1690605 RepID=A0ACC3MYJ8_9PEZI|nr:hypothetical protein LTR37_013136 [Vermiconidia calcicola]
MAKIFIASLFVSTALHGVHAGWEANNKNAIRIRISLDVGSCIRIPVCLRVSVQRRARPGASWQWPRRTPRRTIRNEPNGGEPGDGGAGGMGGNGGLGGNQQNQQDDGNAAAESSNAPRQADPNGASSLLEGSSKALLVLGALRGVLAVVL